MIILDVQPPKVGRIHAESPTSAKYRVKRYKTYYRKWVGPSAWISGSQVGDSAHSAVAEVGDSA
jgi:hypothetical protein